MIERWKVTFSKAAEKQYVKLTLCGQKKPSILDIIDALVVDLELHGPVATSWPNFGIINQSKVHFYCHCHLKKGKPTYVACWDVKDEVSK